MEGDKDSRQNVNKRTQPSKVIKKNHRKQKAVKAAELIGHTPTEQSRKDAKWERSWRVAKQIYRNDKHLSGEIIAAHAYHKSQKRIYRAVNSKH